MLEHDLEELGRQGWERHPRDGYLKQARNPSGQSAESQSAIGPGPFSEYPVRLERWVVHDGVG